MGSIAEEYRSSLNDLNFNSKPLISMLTMLADENKKHASIIVDAIVNHIDSVPPAIKLPGLYLIDSIIKNLGDAYMKIFCQHIITIFSSVFEKVDENTRSLMFKLRQTWTDILPNKVLHGLDVSVKKLDPAWPITAKYSSKKILVNPEFLEKSVEKKQEKVGETSSIKSEEYKIKLKQAEVLKQLRVKQKQLLQLELQKQQMAKQQKKISPVIPSTSLNLPKQIHVRDPRMVKINVPQNAPPLQKNTVPSKSSVQESRSTPFVSDISVQGNLPLPSKAQVLPQTKQSESNASRESLSEPNNGTPKELSHQEKNSPSKYKNAKNVGNKEKLFSVFRAGNSTKTARTTVNVSSKKIDCDKADEKSQDKRPKNASKKKSPVYESSRFSHVNTSVDATKTKVPNQKILKKNERMKSMSDFDLRRKINMSKNEPAKSISIEGEKTKKDNKTPFEPLGTSKCPTKKTDVEPVLSDIKCFSQKDEDLRRLPVPKTGDDETKRIPKRNIETSDFSVLESDKDDAPRKKMKSENNENRNPDGRTGSPFLFGNEDQDLRHSDYPSVKDGNLNDWSQYKASHPSACSPYPSKQEYNGEKLRARKNQFFSSKYYYPTQNERFSSSRYARGRYRGRGEYRQGNFPRANRGRPNSAFDSFMFDSQSVLQQTEEKYRTGRISETAYMELRHDLQKLVENTEYQFYRNEQSNSEYSHQFERNPDVTNPEKHEDNRHAMPDSATGLPMVKRFVLDNKERLIHFVDDKAFILVDNNEPREVSFKNDQRNVFIEGLVKPLTVSFDGKSVEFEVDGRRNILRFGIPGRELYINNHPYEAQFGGSPITVRLRNEHGYKVQLSGPPPQVLIGDVPRYELLDKYNMAARKHAFKEETTHSKKDLNVETQHIMPAVSSTFQDVDMRMNPKPVSETHISKHRPFYDQDMKDIDWRHIPFTENQEHNESVPRVFEGGVSKDEAMWSEQNRSRVKFLEDRHNQPQRFVPKDRLHSGWENSQYSKQDKPDWKCNDYRNVSQTSEVPYPKEAYGASMPPMQHFNNPAEQFRNPKDNHHNLPYPNRLPCPPNQSNVQDLRASSENWPNTYKGPLNQLQSSFRPSNKALLPLPDFPPQYPSLINSALPQSADAITAHASVGTNEESLKDLPGLKNVTSSEVEPSTSSTPNLKVDVESLLQKLVAAGIINTKPDENPVTETLDAPVPETPDTKEETPEPSEEIPEIGLIPENLKVHHIGVISALHKGLQCSTCGMRFKDMKGEQYSHHLDWHFRMNRREKDGAKKAVSRRWYYELEDWLQFEEFEDFEIRVPSYFELQAQDNNQQEITQVPAIVSVPATSDDEETCPVCSENFQLFWVEDEEEWHFRDAVRHDNVTYHPACYEDFKKMQEKSIKENENINTDIQDIEEDVHIVINLLLDGVLEDLSKDSEILNATEAISDETQKCIDEDQNGMDVDQDCMDVDQNDIDGNQNSIDENQNSADEIQKSENDHSEEEILEGKPGEEEIIGLISESDMEMDAEIPRTDAKMVVMQSGGITLKVKAESLQCHSPSNPPEKQTKQEEEAPAEDEDEDIDIDFRPPTPDPRFEVRPLVVRSREVSGLCSIM